MSESVNLHLREHVTSVGFSIQLSKRQIDLLIALHHFKGDFKKMIAWEYAPMPDKTRLRAFSHSVPSGRALVARGLISHEPGDWSVTKAGHLVVALLKQAGIYQDRVKELGIQ